MARRAARTTASTGKPGRPRVLVPRAPVVGRPDDDDGMGGELGASSTAEAGDGDGDAVDADVGADGVGAGTDVGERGRGVALWVAGGWVDGNGVAGGGVVGGGVAGGGLAAATVMRPFIARYPWNLQ